MTSETSKNAPTALLVVLGAATVLLILLLWPSRPNFWPPRAERWFNSGTVALRLDEPFQR